MGFDFLSLTVKIELIKKCDYLQGVAISYQPLGCCKVSDMYTLVDS